MTRESDLLTAARAVVNAERNGNIRTVDHGGLEAIGPLRNAVEAYDSDPRDGSDV